MAAGANSEPINARALPLYIDARVLAAGVNETHTVPAGAEVVFFGRDGDFYARPNGAATVPAADVTDGTASELNPTCWDVRSTTQIGLISVANRVVTMSFYKLKNS